MRGAFVVPVVGVLLGVVGCSTQPKDPSTKAAPPVASASFDLLPTKSEHNSAISFTASDEASIRDQIEQNWNLGGLAGSPEVKGMLVKRHIHLQPDGTVTAFDILDIEPGNHVFRRLADSRRPSSENFEPIDVSRQAL